MYVCSDAGIEPTALGLADKLTNFLTNGAVNMFATPNVPTNLIQFVKIGI